MRSYKDPLQLFSRKLRKKRAPTGPTHFNLFGLPLELRQMIYYYALTVDKSTISPNFVENQEKPIRLEFQMTDRLVSAHQFSTLEQAIPEFRNLRTVSQVIRPDDMLYVRGLHSSGIGRIMNRCGLYQIAYDLRGLRHPTFLLEGLYDGFSDGRKIVQIYRNMRNGGISGYRSDERVEVVRRTGGPSLVGEQHEFFF